MVVSVWMHSNVVRGLLKPLTVVAHALYSIIPRPSRLRDARFSGGKMSFVYILSL